MSRPILLAYLDAGAGAALAAVVASGAVGARALVATARCRVRARFAAPSEQPETSADVDDER